MAEFEEKLNQILSSPAAMEQIMALAGSLSGPLPESVDSRGGPEPASSPPQDGSGSGFGDLLGGLDPGILLKLVPLLSELNAPPDDRAKLLEAMKPFLSPRRQGRVDQAIQLTRMTRLLREAMSIFGEGQNV